MTHSIQARKPVCPVDRAKPVHLMLMDQAFSDLCHWCSLSVWPRDQDGGRPNFGLPVFGLPDFGLPKSLYRLIVVPLWPCLTTRFHLLSSFIMLITVVRLTRSMLAALFIEIVNSKEELFSINTVRANFVMGVNGLSMIASTT